MAMCSPKLNTPKSNNFTENKNLLAYHSATIRRAELEPRLKP